MISDWSGAALEYSFALQKPVIFVIHQEKLITKTIKRLILNL